MSGTGRGPGRPRLLEEPVPMLIRFEAYHVALLEAYAERYQVSGGVSGAVRHILDNYDFGGSDG